MATPDDKTLDDLVRRLRDEEYGTDLSESCADAIAALRERIAALKGQNSRLIEGNLRFIAGMKIRDEHIAALEAVVAAADELNNALIAEQYPRISYLRSEYTAARAALEGK